MKTKKITLGVYAFIAAIILITWLCFRFAPFSQSFADRLSALGVLFTGLALVGLFFTLVRDSTSRSEMAEAITKIEAQNRLQLEMLYLQTITAEMEGYRILRDQYPEHYAKEGTRGLIERCRKEFWFSKERAREQLGIRPTDI